MENYSERGIGFRHVKESPPKHWSHKRTPRPSAMTRHDGWRLMRHRCADIPEAAHCHRRDVAGDLSMRAAAVICFDGIDNRRFANNTAIS